MRKTYIDRILDDLDLILGVSAHYSVGWRRGLTTAETEEAATK